MHIHQHMSARSRPLCLVNPEGRGGRNLCSERAKVLLALASMSGLRNFRYELVVPSSLRKLVPVAIFCHDLPASGGRFSFHRAPLTRSMVGFGGLRGIPMAVNTSQMHPPQL